MRNFFNTTVLYLHVVFFQLSFVLSLALFFCGANIPGQVKKERSRTSEIESSSSGALYSDAASLATGISFGWGCCCLRLREKNGYRWRDSNTQKLEISLLPTTCMHACMHARSAIDSNAGTNWMDAMSLSCLKRTLFLDGSRINTLMHSSRSKPGV